LPESEQAFRLGLSDIQLLRCGYPVSIITQKAILLPDVVAHLEKQKLWVSGDIMPDWHGVPGIQE
jgi:hypothetical protein